VVLYDGQRAEEAAMDSYFEQLYWRLRRLFKVSAFVLFFKQVRWWRGLTVKQAGCPARCT
jgi:hypothetical protein